MVKTETVWQEPEETRLLHSTHQPEVPASNFIMESVDSQSSLLLPTLIEHAPHNHNEIPTPGAAKYYSHFKDSSACYSGP